MWCCCRKSVPYGAHGSGSYDMTPVRSYAAHGSQSYDLTPVGRAAPRTALHPYDGFAPGTHRARLSSRGANSYEPVPISRPGSVLTRGAVSYDAIPISRPGGLGLSRPPFPSGNGV